jgi:FkbM family methyltransferase
MDISFLIVFGAVFLALAGGLLVLRARRAGLAIHRQLDELRGETQALRAEAAARSAAQEARSAQETAGLRTRLDATANSVAQMSDRVLDTNVRAAKALDEVLEIRREHAAGSEALAKRIDGLYPAIAEATEFLARRPAFAVPWSTAELESLSESDLIVLAESIAILRPLVPYPRWRTDADLHNPDLSYQLRGWFWQHFNHRKSETPIVLRWHGCTRLRVFLGNDISAQIYIGGCWEPNEFAFLDRVLKPGMTFVDAGANEGVYAVFAASRVGAAGAVWAFEPSAREVARLKFNLELNSLPARVFPMALADSAGTAELTLGGYEHEPHNTLGAFAYEGIEAAGKQLVDVRRLDEVVAAERPARIDVIKMDVEGAETRLLRGAAAAIEKFQPILLFEVSEASLQNQGSSREELLALVRSYGYSLYVFDRATGLPVEAAPDEYADNMIGLPAGRPMPAETSSPLPLPQGHPANRVTL